MNKTVNPKLNINEFLVNEPAKKFKSERIIRTLFVLLMVLFVGIGIFTYFLLRDTSDLFDDVSSIRLSIDQINDVTLDHSHTFTNSRAYSFSKEIKYKEQYKHYIIKSKNHLDSLKFYLQDIGLNQSYSDIEKLFKVSQNFSDSLIKLSEKDSTADLTGLRNELEGASLKTETYLSDVLNELSDLLHTKVEIRREKLNETITSFAIFIILGTLTLTFSLLLFTDLSRSRNRAYAILQKSYNELDYIVIERTKELEKINKMLVEEIQNRVNQESLLKESEERFRTMAESAPVMIWMTDENNKTTYLNKGWIDFTGKTGTEQINNRWEDGIHPDDNEIVQKIINESIDKHKSFIIEYRLRDKNGDYRWVYDKGAPRFLDKDFLGYIGVVLDAHEMKMNEKYVKVQYAVSKSLAESENIEQGLQNAMTNICTGLEWDFGIIWLVDNIEDNLTSSIVVNNTNITEYNELFDRSYKFHKGTGLPGTVWENGEPLWVEDISRSNVLVRSDAVEVMKFRSAFALPVFIGNEIVSVLELFSKNSFMPDMEIIEVLEAVGRQIGNFIERKKAEDLIKESNLELEDRVKDRTIELANTLTKLLQEIESREKIQNKLKLFAHSIKSIKEAVYITDLNNKLIFVNESFENILCYKENDLLEQELPILKQEDIPLELRENIIEETIKGGWKGEFIATRSDGSKFNIHLSTSIIKNDDGVIEAIIGICQDITEQKETEALIEKRNSLLNLLNDIIKVTNKTFDIESSVAYAINKVCAYTAWDFGHCFFVKDNMLVSSGLINENADVKFDKFKEVSKKSTFRRKEAMPGKCWDEARPLWVKNEDFKDSTFFKRAKAAYNIGLKTGIWAPIMKQNEVVGVMEFFNTEDKQLDYEIMDCIDNIGIELGNIFERVEILEKISESQERFKALAETANDAIITVNSSRQILYVNKAAEDIFGFSSEEFFLNNLDFIIPKKYIEEHKKGFENAVKNGFLNSAGKTVEMSALRKNGEEFPIELSLARWFIDNDIFFTAMIRDITERKEIEKQLFEKQKLLEDAQHIASLGSWEWDISNNKIEWSDELWRIYEIEKNSIELSYESYTKFHHPDDAERINKIIKASFESKEPFSFYHRIITTKGKTKIIKGQGEVFTDEYGNVKRIFSTALDVTEVKEAEEKIRESERKLKEAQHIAKLGSWEWDVVNDKVDWSDEMYNIFDIEPSSSEVVPHDKWLDMVISEDKHKVKHVMANLLKDKKPYTVDYTIKTFTGKNKCLTANGDVKLDDNGNITSFFGTIMDVTYIKEAENKLRKSELQLKEAQHIAKLGNFEWNIKLNKIFFSDELYRIFDIEESQEVQMDDWIELIIPEDRERVEKIRKAARENKEPYTYEFKIRTKNGQLKSLSSHAEIALDENNEIERVFGTVLDITELKQKEEKIIKSEQMLKEAQKIAKLGSFEMNYVTKVTTWSDELRNIFELDKNENIPAYEEMEKMLHPDDVEAFYNALDIQKENPQPVQVTFRILAKNTVKYKYLLLDALPEINKNGKIIRLYGSVQDISEAKEKEQIIISSEKQLKEAQKIAKLGSWEINLITGEGTWSDELLRIFDLEPREVWKLHEYKEMRKFFHPDDVEMTDRIMKKFESDYKPYQMTFRIITHSNKLKWLVADTLVEKDKNKKPIRIYGSIQDITIIKEAEEIIRKSEKQLVEAQHIAKLGSFENDLLTGNIFWSDEMFNIIEIDKSEGAKNHEEYRQFIVPEDLRYFDDKMNNFLNTFEPFQMTYRIKTRSGKMKYILFDTVVDFDKDNKPSRYYGSIQDITTLKQAEEALRKSERQLIDAQRLAKLGSFDWYPETNEITYSDEIFRIYEIERGKNMPSAEDPLVRSRIHPDDVYLLDNLGDELLTKKNPVQVSFRYRSETGKYKYIFAETQTDFDENGKPFRVFGSLQDITEIKSAEKALRESERQLKDSQKMAKLGSFEWYPETNETRFSDEIYRIYEISPSDIPSAQNPEVRKRVHPDDLKKMDELGQQLLETKEPVRLTYRLKSQNGQTKYIFAETQTDFDQNGKPVRVYGSLQDITAIKSVEEELRKTNEKLIEAQRELVHNEKLAALGRFSSGIAHEIRNPLANISALAQLLSRAHLDPKLQKHLEFILKNVDIANKIIRDLLDFAQKDDSDFKEKNVIDILSGILDLVKTRLESNNIDLVKEFETHRFIMPVNEKKLHSSFMNFISNAIEAMPKGGKLFIRSTYNKEHEKFEINIKDTGMGIPKENLDKIFEPFFTTKDTGSGLGMSIAYQAVQLHKGEIDIISEINKGTNIKIQFPTNNH